MDCQQQRFTSQRARRGLKPQSLLTTEVGTVDHVNGWCVLPTNLDVIESIWLEFPANYTPTHQTFGLCSAIESASLIIAEQTVITVSGFDVFAFGQAGPYPNLIQLPVVPSGALHITDRGRYTGLIKLHVVLTAELTVGVVMAKRYYNDDTVARPPPWPMYQFYHVRAMDQLRIPFNPKLRTLQIAVALLDEQGQLYTQARRVSLLLNDVAFDLKLVDPLNPNPKGLYTITFEPFGDVCRPPVDSLVRTSLNLSRVKKSRMCIDMCVDAPRCTALISCIGEAVFLGL